MKFEMKMNSSSGKYSKKTIYDNIIPYKKKQ